MSHANRAARNVAAEGQLIQTLCADAGIEVSPALRAPLSRLERWRYSWRALQDLDRLTFVGAGDAGAAPLDVELKILRSMNFAGFKKAVASALQPNNFAEIAGSFSGIEHELQGEQVHRFDASPAGVLQARHQLHVAADQSALLVWVFDSQGSVPSMTNFLTQIKLAEGAELTLIRVDVSATSANRIENSRIELASQAKLCVLDLQLGGGFVRHDLDVCLAGENAHALVANLMLLNGKQHADLQLSVHHQVGKCTSQTMQKTMVDGRARAVFNGRIEVDRGADGTDAKLRTNSLLQSPHAEVNAKPELEINAEEVSCSHGATVGQLDERALFYLRSRGLDLAQAKAMLQTAFCADVLEQFAQHAKLSNERKSELQRLIDAKLAGGMVR